MIPPLVMFDLDGTLAESKQPLATTTAASVVRLLSVTRVAIISGGALPQFIKQVVEHLPAGADLSHLFLLPTSGAALYEYRNGAWTKVYEELLSDKEASVISSALQEAAQQTGCIDFSEPAWGERIEYRGGQVTLSALGQQAPLSLKKAWDPDHTKRRALREAAAEHLSNYSVSIGGATSIDVSRRGVDKAYGVHQLCERLGIREADALYVGDELESGGNDEAVYQTDIQTKAVAGPNDTEQLIETLLTNASSGQGE